MKKSFDVVVIGTGAAGSTVARRCRAAGRDVAIVDSRPFGGTCALRGCDPKKVLVGAAEVVDWSRRMRGRGVAGGLRIEWPDLMRFKRTFTDDVPGDRERGFEEAGIAAFHGRARFEDGTTIRVGEDRLEGRHLVVAAGAKPMEFGFPGEELLVTSEEFLELEDLPRRIVFLGGGFISFEFAHVAARAGSEVRILEMAPRPLRAFDPDLVETLLEAGRGAGVEVEVDTRVTGIERAGGSFRIVTGSGADFEADMVVHGGGRVPEIDDLDLEAAGVARSREGVVVDASLRSVSNPAVYAAGDAAASPGLPLTPVAAMEGIVVAKNLLGDGGAEPDYAGTPAVVFTIPPLAAVGRSEEEAREEGLAFRVEHEETSGWYASRRVHEEHAGHKILVEEDSGRILGAHLLGAHAEEVINLFALAIRQGIPADALKRVPWAYPTRGSDVPYMLQASGERGNARGPGAVRSSSLRRP